MPVVAVVVAVLPAFDVELAFVDVVFHEMAQQPGRSPAAPVATGGGSRSGIPGLTGAFAGVDRRR